MSTKTDLEWPMQCAMCKNRCKEEPESYAHWRCRQDHHFVVCTVECQRMFDKRCHKVMDAIEKRERSINNQGQMNALRRLPHGERDKLKQKAEAEQHGDWLICPADVKAGDRSVPYCAFCMMQVGGFGKKEHDSPAPPPPGGPTKSPLLGASDDPVPAAAGSSALVDDNMLVVLKKDEDAVEEDDSLPSKKKGKAKKGKEKRNMLVLGIDAFQGREGDGEERLGSGLSGSRSASGVSAWAAGRPGLGSDILRGPALSEISLQESERKVSDLVDIGCSEERARALLEMHQWDAELAAEAFFDDRPIETGGVSRTRWGPRTSVAASQTRSTASAGSAGSGRIPAVAESASAGAAGAWGSQATRAGQSSQQQASIPQPAEAASQPPPAPPTQPPPPCVPSGWKAVWSEEHGAFYFWHVKTNATQWEEPEGTTQVGRPPVNEGPSAEELEAARLAEEQRLAEQRRREEESRRLAERRLAEERAEQERKAAEAEALRRSNLITQAMDITGADEAKAQARLEAQGWDLEATVKMLAAEMERERRRQEQAKRQQEEQEEQLRRQREAEAVAAAAAAAAAAAEAAKAGSRFCEGLPCERVSIRHWRPLPHLENTMRLLQGERVQVSWVDETNPEGWAYGASLDDLSIEGYFPQAILEPLTHDPRQRKLHEICCVTTRFEAPVEIDGYLSVGVGDKVQVLHDMEYPYVWAYAKRVSQRGEFDEDPDCGWLPEAVLSDPNVHPAG